MYLYKKVLALLLVISLLFVTTDGLAFAEEATEVETKQLWDVAGEGTEVASETADADETEAVDAEEKEAADVEATEAADIEAPETPADLEEESADGYMDIMSEWLEEVQSELSEEGGSYTMTQNKDTSGNNIVVVIDPGHDSKHAGAQATWNGVLYGEEKLTLKIAQYCKAELETYAGVTVYMTRTTADCPYPEKTSAADISKRVQAGIEAGADYYVAIHLNASESSSPTGAEVYYPNANYATNAKNSSIAVGRNLNTEGKALAQSILNQLIALGLKDRGVQIVNSATGDTYSDGSAADKYAVQRYNKIAGIPGLIVEHCFLSNQSEAVNYLSTDQKLQKLGIADATGIAKYLGLSKKSNATEGGNTEPDPVVISKGTIESGSLYTINASSLNVRSGAGTSYEKIGTLASDDRVIVYEQKDGWGRILYGGKTGWVSMDYLSAESGKVTRVYGSNRYATALAAADRLLEDWGISQFDTVILANAENYPDALSGSTIAYQAKAPILLVGKNANGKASTLAYVEEKLKAGGQIILLGGSSAVSEEVEKSLSDKGYEVIRLGGATRYETNLLIAEQLEITDTSEVFITSGNGYADALAIAGVASDKASPIILAGAGGLTEEALAYILNISPANVYIIGGEAAVPALVEEQLAELSVTRIAGANRYETAMQIALTFGLNRNEEAILASGVNFPDGLVAGVLAAQEGKAMLLSPNYAREDVKAYLAGNQISDLLVMGGQSAVSDAVITNILP